MSEQSIAAGFCDHLVRLGYTHCFFVAGGNIMHLLDAARSRFTCVPVVHEVAAGIATEYFNETADSARAFALVTAGPGLTNVLTAMAGAWLESRELLVVGGQVKSSDLADDGLRQRGIQEIDGVALARPVAKSAVRVERAEHLAQALDAIAAGGSGRPGPVFLEFCLDAQAAPMPVTATTRDVPADMLPTASDAETMALRGLIASARRPVLLIGGGVDREHMTAIQAQCERLGLPVMTTWNGADRVDAGHPLYWGRPNTWGQRAANVLLQQADLVIAAGTRLGLQQSGFNWQGFAPLARVVHIDIDSSELDKGHPHTDLRIRADAGPILVQALHDCSNDDLTEWRSFGTEVRALLPSNEACNTHAPGFISPYDFAEALSEWLTSDDLVIPCSSGGAFTTMMQAFRQKHGQRIVTDKGLASMGYGLSGALGAAYAHPGSRVVLVEGDGGFAQNLQELGTVAVSGLPIKMFVYVNNGYASIRMTQRNYFGGAWIGCDTGTGLGLPDWQALCTAYGIPCVQVDDLAAAELHELLDAPGPAFFVVPVDPEQTYFPKITSRVLPNGSMESNPLHLMTPELEPATADFVLRYITSGGSHESH